jgi:hypothetical protein
VKERLPQRHIPQRGRAKAAAIFAMTGEVGAQRTTSA